MFGSHRRRDARLAQRWERGLEVGNCSPIGTHRETCTCFGQVVQLRQRARTGMKAYVRWLADQSVTAAWFEGAWPGAGSYVIARGEYSDGTHHAERVFYVASGGCEVLPADANIAWDRHLRRQAKKGRRQGAGTGRPGNTSSSRGSSSSIR